MKSYTFNYTVNANRHCSFRTGATSAEQAVADWKAELPLIHKMFPGREVVLRSIDTEEVAA